MYDRFRREKTTSIPDIGTIYYKDFEPPQKPEQNTYDNYNPDVATVHMNNPVGVIEDYEQVEPTTTNKPSDPATDNPFDDIIENINNMFNEEDNLPASEDETAPSESCFLQENLNNCTLFMCSMIRGVLSYPFPECYSTTQS